MEKSFCVLGYLIWFYVLILKFDNTSAKDAQIFVKLMPSKRMKLDHQEVTTLLSSIRVRIHEMVEDIFKEYDRWNRHGDQAFSPSLVTVAWPKSKMIISQPKDTRQLLKHDAVNMNRFTQQGSISNSQRKRITTPKDYLEPSLLDLKRQRGLRLHGGLYIFEKSMQKASQDTFGNINKKVRAKRLTSKTEHPKRLRDKGGIFSNSESPAHLLNGPYTP